MEQIEMKQIDLLVKGEENEYDDLANPYISNRTENEIDPSLKKLFKEDYNETYPFLFRNFNRKNREEKIYDIISYENVSMITMIKWKYDRSEFLMECVKKQNTKKYNNGDYNLKYYLLSSYFMDRFYEKQIITKKLTNGSCPIFSCNGDLDVFAFSRDNFRPKKFPVNIDGDYIIDDLDLLMLRLEENQMKFFKDSQKKALYLEYKRIRRISPRVFSENQISLKKPGEYSKFLGVVSSIIFAWPGQRKNAYKRFINYFNLTKNDSDEFFSKEYFKENMKDLLIYEKIEKNKILNEIDENNNIENNEEKEEIGLPINFLNNKRENDVRIYTNYDDEGFPISFLKKKK